MLLYDLFRFERFKLKVVGRRIEHRFHRHQADPVSYTHLDVYKRQRSYRLVLYPHRFFPSLVKKINGARRRRID